MNAHRLKTLGLISLLIGCSTKQAEMNLMPLEENEIEEEQLKERVDKDSFSTEYDFADEEIESEPVSGANVTLAPSPQRDSIRKKEAITSDKTSRSEKKNKSAKVSRPPIPGVPNAVAPQESGDDGSQVIPDTINNGEEYTDYGVNSFVNSSEDNLSTFSIDVDTASYAIARRKLNEGKLPAYAGIRVEEFINYFDYNYSTKEASPFNVDMETMVHPFKEDRHILRVGLQGMEYSADNRPPLHLTFLVDVSGSMSSADKLPLAKEAMHMLVDTMHEGDTVALVTYAGNVSRILEPTHGDSKKKIHSAIERLNSGGSTAMSSGMDIAYEMAWETFEPGAENRVVVLSDGDANVGNTSWTDMLKQIKSYADRGITMSTIGLGMGNYKDTRMEQLANKGDGNNFYIDSRAQAHRVFVEDFNSTMISIARDVKIQMEFNPKVVQSYRLIGYENRDIADKDFRNDKVDAGEIGSGHNVTALYELVLTDTSRNNELAVARVRYEKPGPDSIATERSWTVSTSEINSERLASNELKLAFTAGTFAEILRRSPYVSSITLSDLISYGERNQRRGEKDDVELITLMKKAEKLGAGPTFVSR
jgi:Ca-activated chloride channel homolog